MGKVSYANRAYAIADALGMALDGVGEDGKFTGGRIKKWRVDGEALEFSQKIVHSVMVGDDIAVVVRIGGNLAALTLCDGGSGIQTHFINMAKMRDGIGWSKIDTAKNGEECLAILGNAIVRSFRKIDKKKWEEITA